MPAYVTTFHSEIFSTVFLIVHTTMVIVLPERFKNLEEFVSTE